MSEIYFRALIAFLIEFLFNSLVEARSFPRPHDIFLLKIGI